MACGSHTINTRWREDWQQEWRGNSEWVDSQKLGLTDPDDGNMWLKGKEIGENDHKNFVLVGEVYAGGSNVPVWEYSLNGDLLPQLREKPEAAPEFDYCLSL